MNIIYEKWFNALMVLICLWASIIMVQRIGKAGMADVVLLFVCLFGVGLSVNRLVIIKAATYRGETNEKETEEDIDEEDEDEEETEEE